MNVLICFCRASENLLPPVTRSLSVQDSGSVWEMQTPSSQASCTPKLPQAPPSSEFPPSIFCRFGSFLSYKRAKDKVCHGVANVLNHILSLQTAWDGSSVWDLPIDSMAQAPTIEQMQQYEKSKSAKVTVFILIFLLLSLQKGFVKVTVIL